MTNNTPLSSEITDRISAVWDYCNEETRQLIDDLFLYWETTSMDLDVLNLHLQKQWTAGSNLYSQKEVDALEDQNYNAGFLDGQESCRQNYDGHFIR